MSLPRAIFWLCWAVSSTCSVGCMRFAEAYDKEYVLWDSRRAAEAADAASGQEAAAASRASDSRPAATMTPVERIFVWEAELAELERAIREGLDEDGVLSAQHARLDAQIVAWKREHGEEYLAARRERLRAMAERDR